MNSVFLVSQNIPPPLNIFWISVSVSGSMKNFEWLIELWKVKLKVNRLRISNDGVWLPHILITVHYWFILCLIFYDGPWCFSAPFFNDKKTDVSSQMKWSQKRVFNKFPYLVFTHRYVIICVFCFIFFGTFVIYLIMIKV